ncbi:hypothetical protein V2J09_014412 [Rumex salicifolius]
MNATKISVLYVVLVLFTVFELGFCRNIAIVRREMMGGVRNCKGFQFSAEIESLARFAVHEYNRRENGILEFAKVLRVQEQVVAGTLYHLTLVAVDGGMKKIYVAKIWVKPWMNFKQLQEFKTASNVSTADLGLMRNCQNSDKSCLSHHVDLKFELGNVAVAAARNFLDLFVFASKHVIHA